MFSQEIFISCDVRVNLIYLGRAKSIERSHAEVTLHMAEQSRSYSP